MAGVGIYSRWNRNRQVVVHSGDNRALLSSVAPGAIQLIISSPPYNVGKEYERRSSIDEYVENQRQVISACVPLLAEGGSICWQVGNHVTNRGEVVPLDAILYPLFKEQGLVLRNRIIWHFGHGLHARRRFSGRYETALWFTRDVDDYVFNLDAVRVPQKYPGKRAYKGPNVGQYSGHPGGKNPSDYWGFDLEQDDPGDIWGIPNVKANHVEKTEHPCQFPVALVTRFVRALSLPDDWVLDPYMGAGTALCAAVMEGRRAAGAEMDPSYVSIAKRRIRQALAGELPHRPLEREVYSPTPGSPLTIRTDHAGPR